MSLHRYQPTQPNRPGSCGYEKVDADTYVNDWQVDQVKDDGCGGVRHLHCVLYAVLLSVPLYIVTDHSAHSMNRLQLCAML